MTMAEETAAHLAQLEERMKTQHAKGVTHIANQARHHTSQIADIKAHLSNMSIEYEQLKTEFAKREVRAIILMIAVMALMTTILGILIRMPD